MENEKQNDRQARNRFFFKKKLDFFNKSKSDISKNSVNR